MPPPRDESGSARPRSDEDELVRRAHEDRRGPDLIGLIAHLRRWVGGIIRQRGRCWKLTAQELRDAQEEVPGWIDEAVKGYYRDGRPRDYSFRSHLALVVQGRLMDFLRHRRSEEKLFDRSVDAAVALDARVRRYQGDRWLQPWLGPEPDDPAVLVATREFWARLVAMIDQLDGNVRVVGLCLLNGLSRPEIAGTLGVSTRTAERLCQQLREELWPKFRDAL